MIDPAMWRVGRTPGEKTVGASTKARKITPPSQTTSDNTMRNRRNDMSEIIVWEAGFKVSVCQNFKTWKNRRIADRNSSVKLWNLETLKPASRVIHSPEPTLSLSPVHATVYPHPSPRSGGNHPHAALNDGG